MEEKKKVVITWTIIIVGLICGIVGFICGIACGLNRKNREYSEYLYEKAKQYMISQTQEESVDKDKENFNVFIAYKGFGSSNEGETKVVYILMLIKSYYVEDGKLYSSAESSIPYKISFNDEKVVEVEMPKDGEQYYETAKELFPSKILNKILDLSHYGDSLNNEISEQLKEYYTNINTTNINYK